MFKYFLPQICNAMWPVAGVISISLMMMLFVIFLYSLRYRRMFISKYPPLRRSYDVMTAGWAVTTLSKLLFLPLDLNDWGLIGLSSREMMLFSVGGNLLMGVAVFLLILGWTGMITSVMKRHTLVPVVELEGGDSELPSPGLYISFDREGAYSKFLSFIRGHPGLIISRNPPNLVRERLGLDKTPVLWITKVEDRSAVHPTRLPYLLASILEFMKNGEENTVILFDCVEYLVIENGFEAIFKFFGTLKDYAYLNKSVIIAFIDKDALSSRERALLLSEFLPMEG